jgi:hypothetical protein
MYTRIQQMCEPHGRGMTRGTRTLERKPPEVLGLLLCLFETEGHCSPYPYYLSPCVVFGLEALALVFGAERGVASLLTRLLLADGVYDFTNRVNNKLRLLLMYVMAAVRNVPGARHLAHKICPGLHRTRSRRTRAYLRLRIGDGSRC